MDFTETFEYPADIDQVWQMLSDPKFAEGRAKALKVVDPSVSTSASAEAIKQTTTGAVPQDLLPGPAKRFVSPNTKVTITEEWRRVDSGNIRGVLDVSASGVPAGLHAQMELAGASETTKATMNGNLKINIPLLGKRLEKEAIALAPRLAKGEVQNAKAYLAAK